MRTIYNAELLADEQTRRRELALWGGHIVFSAIWTTELSLRRVRTIHSGISPLRDQDHLLDYHQISYGIRCVGWTRFGEDPWRRGWENAMDSGEVCAGSAAKQRPKASSTKRAAQQRAGAASEETQHQVVDDGAASGDESDTSMVPAPTKGKGKGKGTRRRKKADQFKEEDIIDGFAFISFKSQDDLEVSVPSWSSLAVCFQRITKNFGDVHLHGCIWVDWMCGYWQFECSVLLLQAD